MWKKLFFILPLILVAFGAECQNTIIKGIVTDSITGETLPYVSVIVKGTTIGTATDDNGKFSFTSSSKVRTLVISYLGYNDKHVLVSLGKTNDLKVRLAPSSIALKEVVVKPKKEKYSKKENPAVTLIKHVIDSRDSNDPRNHDYFTYDQYERMVFAMNDFHPKAKKDSTKTSKLDFLVDFIDTLDVGTTILPVSEKEKLQTVYFRKDPKSERTVLKASKSSGVDEIFSRQGVAQFLNEVFREVNIFQNDIPLFLQRFVSPISTIGPNYYKYYLLDTLEVNGKKTVDLGFVPFNAETFGFTGHLYVALDSTYFVQRVKLNVPKNINLNFVSGMTIEQSFEREPDGTRVITKDDINVNFKINEKSKGMYARRLCIYSNQAFTAPTDPELFKQSSPIITMKNAYTQNEAFWTSNRPANAGVRKKNSVEMLMSKLRSIPLFYATEEIVSVLVNGYIPTAKDKSKSQFEFGPANTFVSGNAIEGGRFRMGGTTTTAFSKRLFVDGFMAYGTKDEKLKYDGLIEYSFVDKKEFRKEFPVHSLRFECSYDINNLGQEYMYTNKDNMFLAWKRQKDSHATYLRNTELTYYCEHYNGLAYGAVLRNLQDNSSPYAEFNQMNSDGTIEPRSFYRMSELELNFRYAPNEKFYQTRNYRIPITYDAPIFTLKHVMAGKNIFGSTYTYNRTDLGFEKRFWFSAFGFVDMIIKSGKVWNAVPYPLLILPSANLSYTVQPESYTNLNAMEFINDEYASWDLTYYMNGNLLNRLPVIKKLKWREVFAFRGLYGNLTDKNNPASPYHDAGIYTFPEGSYKMGKRPYMEASVGIENIFKFLRLDYVWRLSYRNHPNIQDRGIRFLCQLSF